MSEDTESVREHIESDPFCRQLGIELVELGAGYAKTEMVVEEAHSNFHGTIHGGAIHSLADSAFAAASNAASDTTAVGLETNMSYLEAVSPGATLTATAEETHASGRTASYEVVVTEGDERVATFRGRVYRL